LRCLDYKAPLEILSNLPGHNTCAGMTRGESGAQTSASKIQRDLVR
jgi:hypothetical protein